MRNVVLVTVDSLRADYVTPYADISTTPELDGLANSGVVYKHAIAPGPSTPQSMPAIWTGSYPSSHSDNEKRELIRNHLSSRVTLTERFSQLGYATAAFTPNPFTSRYYGFNIGFDNFEDFLDNNRGFNQIRSWVVRRWMRQGSVFGARFALNMIGFGDISTTWESYYDQILSWTDQATEPWFLWIFLLEPHWPYRPPQRYRNPSLFEMYRANLRRAPATDTRPLTDDRETLLDLYIGTIRHTDELIGRLRSDFDDPIIAVHGDHGEAFGEHGRWGHGSSGFGAPLFEENIRVPFIIGNIGHNVIETPISLRSLGDVLIAAAVNENDWDKYTDQWVVTKSSTVGIRGQSWKYLEDLNGKLAYDLESDPEEKVPLFDDHPLLEIGDPLVTRFQESQVEKHRLKENTSKVIQELPTNL